MEYISTNESQTQEIAATILKEIHQGGVLALTGDLGAGKTTFVKGLAKALNIHKIITSPTFVIVKEYKVPANNYNIDTLVHADCYRLNNKEDAESVGLIEALNDRSRFVVLEWPENIKEALPPDTVFINFQYLDQNKRKITVKL